MKIWAHRGCSLRYPENTLTSFSKAIELKGLEGIELDIQLTKDNYMVVIHDEKVDRTTDSVGAVCTYNLDELKNLEIDAGNGNIERIPTIEEVLDLIHPAMQNGLRLNIELKNSVIPYCGMEEKILDLISRRGLESNVVYSSFYAKSIKKIKMINPNAETGILDTKVSDCLFKLNGGTNADALHPFARSIDLLPYEIKGYPVRAWFTGYLYPTQPSENRLNLEKLESQGITDVFLNEPEVYL